MKREYMDGGDGTHNQRILILVRIRLHIPNNLMRKQLRELCRLENKPLDIPQLIPPQRLDNLGHIKERRINAMTLQRPHRILKNKCITSIRREEEHCCRDRIHWSPIEKIILHLDADISGECITEDNLHGFRDIDSVCRILEK